MLFAKFKKCHGVYKKIHYSRKIIFLSDGPKVEQTIWATGFTNNPNFFATYMLLCESFALGLYIEEKKIIKSIIYLLLTGFFVVGILICNTTSCVVGFIAVSIFVLVYCIKNKYIKKIIFLTVGITCVILFVCKTGKTNLIKDIRTVGSESTEIMKGNIKDNYGTKRIFLWKKTLEVVPKNLVHGVGIDNFYYAFGEEPLYSPDNTSFFDKAHNEYLQILITEGIFCLISYIGLYVITGVKSLKNCFKNKEVCFILPMIGYLVQAFFNISVIEVAPVFYITLGFNMDNGD